LPERLRVRHSDLMADSATFERLRGQVFTSYQQGDYPHTLRLALESVRRFPEHRAEATFWVACMHSLLGDPDGAVHVLQNALKAGMWWAPTRLRDPDLDAARESAGFADVSSESERVWSDACSEIEPVVRLRAHPDSSGRLLVVLHGWTAGDEDMEPLWVSAVETGLTLAYIRSSQPDTSDRTRFYWGDAEHTSADVAKAIETASDRLGRNQHTVLLGGFSAGGRFALELALRGEPEDIHGAIAVGAALPRDMREFPVAARGGHGVRAWLLVGEEDYFREANESLEVALRKRNVTCRLTLVPNLGHDLPQDLPQRLQVAIPFALAEDA
jgi:predicted esterase